MTIQQKAEIALVDGVSESSKSAVNVSSGASSPGKTSKVRTVKSKASPKLRKDEAIEVRR